MALTLDLPLTALPGVGPARAAQLEKLGLRVYQVRQIREAAANS